jgi:hypothetical protein
MENTISIELAQESDYDTRPNRWRITRGTQPKGKISCLESCCYDGSSLNLKHVVIPRLDWHEHYLTHQTLVV